MYFISLVKFKKKLTKAVVAENLAWVEEDKKAGIKFHGLYWTLGKYDAIAVIEAPNEKDIMKMAIKRGDNMTLETLVAVPLEEAKKLVE
ncbi:uncharacterized protein with GYD domain [Methanolinea mesophila]|uniref:GYD domain-containing protein n=1 Tax=Methanolinea mesophila TaxID=547055 RepID=UPI001AE2251F|nr:GYD domain-containing protein [Methanolinea mesophila]MBP1927815.1 uncharacterized protein with GYD domain [Methanolinea mesophila]